MSQALDARLDVVRSSRLFSDDVLSTFARYVKEAPEDELFRMSPIRYARARGISDQQGIDLFLHATRAGILEFSWGVLCPACRGFLTTEAALRSLAGTKHCTLCDVDAVPDDDSVEVAFTVSPAVRAIRFHNPDLMDLSTDGIRSYFSSSLDLTPESLQDVKERIQGTVVIPPNGTATLKLRVEEGEWYALAAPYEHAWARILPEKGGLKSVHFEVAEGMAAPSVAKVDIGEVSLQVHNCLAKKLHVGVMAVPQSIVHRPLEPYLTGKRLVATQAFRDLFRSESIPAQNGLALKSMTVLFTDLKGSTEMYERIGDLRAYELVNEHFRLLQKIIASRGGAMVKTIGDAIMASFAEPEAALDAAITMNKDIRSVGKGELQLKIGVHTGPCIAVELNERLDYFGQTVNVAARVQGVADANEICVTEPVLKSTAASSMVKSANLALQTKKELLKGVEGQVTVHHLR